MLVEEVLEAIDTAVTIVFDESLRLGTVGGVLEEVDGREASNIDTVEVNLVLGGIDLGDDQVLLVSELSGKFLIDRHEVLAVTTPRGVEHDKGVDIRVDDTLIEVLADNGLDRGLGLLISIGDLSGLEERLELVLKEGIDEVDEGLSREAIGLVKRELLHGRIIRHADKDSSREVLLLDAEIRDDALLLGVDDNVHGLARKSLGNFSEGVNMSLGVISGSVNENQEMVLDLATEDLRGSFRGEVDDKRDSVGVDEVSDLADSGGRSSNNLVVLLLEVVDGEDSVVRNTEFRSNSSIRDHTEGDIVNGVSNRAEVLGGGGLGIREVTEDNDVLVGDDGLGGSLGGNRLGARTGLLLDPGDNLVGSASTIVFLGVLSAATEELQKGNMKIRNVKISYFGNRKQIEGNTNLQSREALDSEALGEGLLDSAVNLGKLQVVGGKGLGSSGIFRSELLAVSTPLKRQEIELGSISVEKAKKRTITYRSVELNQKGAVLRDSFIKVLLGQDENSIFFADVNGENLDR